MLSVEASFFQVSPSSCEIYSPGTEASTIASTSCGLEGLMLITILPISPSGSPAVTFDQVFPPSAERNSPLPFPPE